MAKLAAEAKACGEASGGDESLVAELVAKACGESSGKSLWPNLVAELVAKPRGKRVSGETLWRKVLATSILTSKPP